MESELISCVLSIPQHVVYQLYGSSTTPPPQRILVIAYDKVHIAVYPAFSWHYFYTECC